MIVVTAFAGALLAASSPGPIFETELLGHWDGGGSYADVWGDGTHAFVAHYGESYVDIVDVSDPSAPAHVAAYHLPPPDTMKSAQDVKVHDGLMFIGLDGKGGHAVQVVDVRDPSDPRLVVNVGLLDFSEIHNVFFADGFLYMVDSGSPRVGIFDLRSIDPEGGPYVTINQPKWMLEDVGTSVVHDVTVANGRLYASAWDSGVWIYDVSDLAHVPPRFMGSGPGENTHSCWPTADGAYVIAGEERPGGGIIVYRVVDEGDGNVSLTVTDAVALPPEEASSVHNQVAVGYRVYNSWYGAGLRVYDVDRAHGTLRFVAGYDDPTVGQAWGVGPQLGPSRVLLSSIGSGLFVINVQAPPDHDLDGDGAVGVSDLLVLLASWGACGEPPSPCPADLDADGAVTFADLLQLLRGWS